MGTLSAYISMRFHSSSPASVMVVSESNVAASAKVALGDAEACIFAARSTKTTEVPEVNENDEIITILTQVISPNLARGIYGKQKAHCNRDQSRVMPVNDIQNLV
jgi:hypothetical protein